MAQHYVVDLKNEKKQIEKSINRICRYVSRSYVSDKFPIYTKQVEFLPIDYEESETDRAIVISSYNLNKKVWENNANNATLEVHFNRNTGEVSKVYYPL